MTLDVYMLGSVAVEICLYVLGRRYSTYVGVDYLADIKK